MVDPVGQLRDLIAQRRELAQRRRLGRGRARGQQHEDGNGDSRVHGAPPWDVATV